MATVKLHKEMFEEINIYNSSSQNVNKNITFTFLTRSNPWIAVFFYHLGSLHVIRFCDTILWA